MDKILVTDIHCSTIVGINPAERVNRQNIIINLTMYYNIEKCGISDDIDDTGTDFPFQTAHFFSKLRHYH